MTLKNSLPFILFLLLLSCGSNSNSEEFIKKTSGRYLLNSDEIVEVYFNESELYLKWRGANSIKPLKVSDETFFVKEMNEKIQFLTNPIDQIYYLVFVPKKDSDSIQYIYRKLDEFEKIPSEYLNDNQFDKALEAYLAIQKKDSLDSTINEHSFNNLGYDELHNKNYNKALNVFKINIELYPESANVYDSYADALKRSGDTIQAIEYYKKSLAIDSGNKGAKKFIEKYSKKE